MTSIRIIEPGIFVNEPLSNRRFIATYIEEYDLYTDPGPLLEFVRLAEQSNTFGIAGSYVPCNDTTQRDGSAALLTKLAIATPDQVLVITLHFPSGDPADVVDHTLLYQNFFSLETNPRRFVGFFLDRLALQLFGEYDLWIQNGIDALSIGINTINEARIPAVFANVHRTTIVADHFTELMKDESDKPENDNHLAVRAWAGAVLEQASEDLAVELAATPPIDLRRLQVEELLKLKGVLQSSDRLRGTAPEAQVHDIAIERKKGKYYGISNMFNSRIRMTTLDLEIEFKNATVLAKVIKVKGKSAELKLAESIDLGEVGEIVKARTLGKEEETALDHQRSNIILFAIQRGRESILDNPFLQYIWFPERCDPQPSLPTPTLYGERWKKLNRSQLRAVQEMLKESTHPRICLVHGPPGTGKTSVIAAMTESLLLSEDTEPQDDESINSSPEGSENESNSDIDEDFRVEGPTIWIVAQSNVAVKNVAEKLEAVGIEEYKLIVSKEFHFEWHEHLYTAIERRMCTSGNLPSNKSAMAAFLRGTRVILCTLSMLTSPRLQELGFSEIIPVNNVVVDEASQIQLGDLLPMFHLFRSDLKRICLVGDHKQLAPYGQEEVAEIESIFEVKHIVDTAVLLNITYRLPKPISNIISSKVYDTRLIPASTEERPTCCKWIDVPGEEEEENRSYVNKEEVDACMLLAKQLEENEKDYRIISPYASQTNLILSRMKEEGLQWQDKCFNVDSFQGNEADYIVISLVRSKSMGFLDNNRRANVLLTRCKKGMFVLCNRELIMSDRAQHTLLGQFASRWQAEQERVTWPNHEDLKNGAIMIDKELTSPTASFRKGKVSSEAASVSSKRDIRKQKRGEKQNGKGKPKRK